MRYFVAAADHGSFRKAGVALRVNQSAISRRIRDLEDELGASLFHRRPSGILLTEAGKRFLRDAREGIRAIQTGTQSVRQIGRGEHGAVRIGIFSSLASGFLSELVRAYDRAHRGIRIDFVDGGAAEHAAAVRQLRMDVAFVAGTSTWCGCDAIHLWSERVFAVLSENDPLAMKNELGWSDLSRRSFIVSDVGPSLEIQNYLVKRLAEFGGHPQIRHQSVGLNNLMPLVSLRRELTLTSEATTGLLFLGVVYRPITGETVPYSAIWSRDNDNPACRRLLSLARSMARAKVRR